MKADDEALTLIARAADGSARDGLSMLDQAIALSQGDVTAQKVKDMLGLADRGMVLDLLEKTVTGDPAGALGIMEDLYRKGADPSVVIGDMLDLSHLLTKLKAIPSAKTTLQAMAKEEMERAALLAAKLSMPALARIWQILLKGLNEVNYAPIPQKAAEMVVIRLAYAADLPDPADLVKRWKEGGANAMQSSTANAPAPMTASPPQTMNVSTGGGPQAALAAQPQSMAVPVTSVSSIADVQMVLEQAGYISLSSQVYLYAHPVKVEEGRLEFRSAPEAPASMAQELTQALKAVTGKRWMVSVSTATGAPTLHELASAQEKARFDAVRTDPLVARVFEMFPDAALTKIHTTEE